MKRSKLGGTVFAAAVFLFLTILCLFVGVFQWSGKTDRRVQAGLRYYFLVRDCSSATAGAVAGESYLAGGAGYLLESENAVVLACYYREEDAAAVAKNMAEKGVETRVLTQSSADFSLSDRNAGERDRVRSNAKTLDSLSRILFDAANGLERAEYTQEEARAALEGVSASLEGLVSRNEGELYRLWNVELSRAARRGRELSEGLLFSKDLRYLQVSLCFTALRLSDYFG